MKAGSRPACKGQAADGGRPGQGAEGRGVQAEGAPAPHKMGAPQGEGQDVWAAGAVSFRPGLQRDPQPLLLCPSRQAASLGVWSHKAAGAWAPQTPGAEPPPGGDRPALGAGPTAPGGAGGWGIGAAEATVGGTRGGCPAPWPRWLGTASPPGTWAQTVCPMAQRVSAAGGGVEGRGGP